MKKIIFLIISLFIVSTKVSALYTFHFGQRIDNVYVYREKGSNKHTGMIFEILDEQNEIIYCIDPFTIGIKNEEYEIYFDTNHPFDISSETLNKINTIAHFGYGYENHTDIKWYAITQYLIWNELGLDKLYFVDSNGNRVNIFTEEINEINKLIQDYNILPSFDIDNMYNANETYTLEDKNNVLDKYTIHSSDVDAKIENNKLIISSNTKGAKNIILVKHDRFRPTCLFYLSGSQSLIKPGFIKAVKTTIKIRVVVGSINLLKRSKGNIVLPGATYGIYKDDVLLDSKITDQDGRIVFDNLSIGTYQIKEIEAPPGYLLDPKVHEITIGKYSSHGLSLYDEPIYEEIQVSVPNTGINKEIRTKYICLVYIGITLIICSLKKTTHE